MKSIERLSAFLHAALTPYHAQALIQSVLLDNGFTALSELDEEWQLSEGGKYFVERNGATLAFTVGNPDTFSYKIAASHLDSPALKLKENAFMGPCSCKVLYFYQRWLYKNGYLTAISFRMERTN